MEKASKAFRRSSVRIRSAGSGHTDLQLVISEIKEMRAAARWFQSSQTSALGDLLKWSLRGENRAIQETAAQLVELNMIWSDAQKSFTDNLKDYKQQFELMLEGENQVDNCKQKLSLAEAKEAKLRKEYKKAFKREQPSEILDVETQLKQATHASELAQEEMTECSKENEAVKLIRMKQSLIKISESYLELAHKCIHIFEAQREVALALPDVQDANVENIKYTGAVSGRQAVLKAKEKVERYRRNSVSSEAISQPPPYNPHYSQANNVHRRSNTCPEFMHPQPNRSWGWNVSEPMSEDSPPNRAVNVYSPPALNDRYH
ncbi:uncharacterized protein LOC116926133 [Daphnia magna]|nr:uncharacterized protein LOC116926133 [Daphnia magna]KAK4026191.1 hypothetical protein OUZ56_015208 [Daphnia magna]